VEHDGTNNVRSLRTDLGIGGFADVEVERRIQTGTSSGDRETDNSELSHIQDL